MASSSGVIASLLIKLGLDTRDVQAGAQDAEAAIGGIGTRTKVALGIAGAAAAAGFAVMTKGALEGEQAMGRFQAQTGRSADEAKAFVLDMNDLVGSGAAVGRSFEDIADTGTRVTQQFGLAGAAGKGLTADFLAFAKVTGQGADVVDDFDAALDAFNEPAERASSLMDQLIAGNQRYGTDAGPASLRALKELAPALTGLNLGLDDAVAMLNLFEAAGMDSSKASFALNQAIRKLEPGQTFDDLVREISAIEDPTKRAQKAIEVFGARGGVNMANALKPGIDGLDDFAISADEAADASETASEAMVTTGQRIKGFVDHALAGLRGLGTEMGPLISGLGGLTMAFGPALSKGLQSAWKMAGGPAVRAAAAAAGALAGLAYEAAAFVGLRFTAAAGAVWGMLGGPRALAAASSAGQAAGVAFAGAAGAGGLIGAVTTAVAAMAPLAIPVVVSTVLTDMAGDPAGDFLKKTDLLQEGRDIKKLEDERLAIANELNASYGEQGDRVDELHRRFDELNEEITRLRPAHDAAVRAAYGLGEEAGQGYADGVVDGAAEGIAAVVPEVEQAYDPLSSIRIPPPVPDLDGTRRSFAEMRKAILQGFGSVKDALEHPPQLISREDRIENMESRMKKVMRNLHKAVAADDPINVGYWSKAALKQQAQLDRMRGKSKTSTDDIKRKFAAMGVDIEDTWLDTRRKAKAATEGARDDAKGAARQTVEGVEGIFGAADLFADGVSLVTSWAAGIRAGIPEVVAAAAAAAQAAADYLVSHSPPERGPLSAIDEDGGRLVEAWAGGMEGRLGRVRQAADSVAGAFRPSLATTGGVMGAGRRGGDTHYHFGNVYGGPAGLRELGGAIDRASRPASRQRRLNNLPEG